MSKQKGFDDKMMLQKNKLFTVFSFTENTFFKTHNKIGLFQLNKIITECIKDNKNNKPDTI